MSWTVGIIIYVVLMCAILWFNYCAHHPGDDGEDS